MNNIQLVAAVRYLLEARQGELLRTIDLRTTNKSRQIELNDEVREIEDMVEQARQGSEDWQEEPGR